MKNQQSFTELLESYDDALAACGIGVTGRLGKLQRSTVIVRRHEALGKDCLDDAVVSDYICEISEKLSSGAIGEKHANTMLRETEQFVQFAKTGEVKLPNPLLGSRTALLPAFKKIADGFLGSDHAQKGAKGRPTSQNTLNDMRWAVHKYFEWLAERGFSDLRGAGAEQIQGFMLRCSETMAMGSVHNVRLFMTKLYAYLHEAGLSQSSFASLLAFRVNRDRKIPETRDAGEIAAMLETIDRTTAGGKRSFAVMMLGIVLGLRACDIVALRLSDIDWINGEIKILQAKTEISAILPLTKDVGEALLDYIMNARPQSGCGQVFLRLHSPHTGLKSAASVGEIYEACCKASGIPHSRRFHTLRRSLGTSMLASGTPVTTVAQVLGHADVDSTKRYIAVDKERLKMCALPFDGINPKGGARK